jgi:hypothetical protein
LQALQALHILFAPAQELQTVAKPKKPRQKWTTWRMAPCHTQGYHLCMTEESATASTNGFESLAFFAADHAVVENNKAYINGGFWDRILQVSYPAQISVSLVAVLRVPADAYLANHRLAVEMEDANRQKIPTLKIEGEFRVGASPALEPGEPTTMPVAFPLDGLTIERAGDYWFVLSVDGDELDRFKVRAVQIGLVAVQPPEIPETGDDATPAQ